MLPWKVHPEGQPWVLGSGLSAWLLWKWGRRRMAIGPALAALALAYFFRDPERHPPPEERCLVSPADGRVVTLKRTVESSWLNAPAWQIGIFMSVLDVHINRSPITARVVKIEHFPGSFLPAYQEEVVQRNERCVYYLETKEGDRILVVQVAGIVARRIVPFVQAGEELLRGQRLGLIRFGSRVEVFLPLTAQPLVRVGHRLRAGETPIAWYPPQGG